MNSRRLTLVVWLTLLWLVLWRDVTVANVLSGLAAATVVTSVFPGVQGEPSGRAVRPYHLLRFFLYFHWKLLEANVMLAREIVTPRDYTKSGIIAIPLGHSSDLLVTLVANAITLTPGTVTLEARGDPAVLYVHVLHLHDPERARRDIRTLRQYAGRALGQDVPNDRTAAGNGEPSTEDH